VFPHAGIRPRDQLVKLAEEYSASEEVEVRSPDIAHGMPCSVISQLRYAWPRRRVTVHAVDRDRSCVAYPVVVMAFPLHIGLLAEYGEML
jgi:hypothetical protein